MGSQQGLFHVTIFGTVKQEEQIRPGARDGFADFLGCMAGMDQNFRAHGFCDRTHGGRWLGIWALKSPRLFQYTRLSRSTSATATVPHSLPWASTLPSWPKTALIIQFALTSP